MEITLLQEKNARMGVGLDKSDIDSPAERTEVESIDHTTLLYKLCHFFLELTFWCVMVICD